MGLLLQVKGPWPCRKLAQRSWVNRSERVRGEPSGIWAFTYQTHTGMHPGKSPTLPLRYPVNRHPKPWRAVYPWPVPQDNRSLSRWPFEDGRNAQTSTAANRFKPSSTASPLHLVKEGDQNSRSCAGDRMAKRDA